MAYYTEGTIKNLSINNGTFQLSPTKEFLHEKDGKKHLLLANKNKGNDLTGGARLEDLQTVFSISKHKEVLAILATNKTKIALEIGSFSPTSSSRRKSPIVVSDVIVV